MDEQMQGANAAAPDEVGLADDWRSFVAAHTGRDGRGSAKNDSDNAFLVHMRQLLHPPNLDVDVVSHCNLNCACCCHFSPIAEPSFLSLEEYRGELEQLARIEGAATYFGAICLMGGEPLLNPELPSFILLTHEILPETQVRVVTNGKLLASMPDAFWDAMRSAGADMLMTPYPIGIDYGALLELATSKGIDAVVGGGLSPDEESDSEYFLRVPLDETGSQNRRSAFVECPLAGSTMQLLNGRIYPCNRGALFDTVNKRFGTSFAHEEGDWLELGSIRNAEEIDTFRRTARPMCRYCASSFAERIEWHPSTFERDEWLMRPDEYERMEAERDGCDGASV